MKPLLAPVLALAALGAASAPGSTKVNDSPTANSPRVVAGPSGELVVMFYDSSPDWSIARFDARGNRVFGPAAAQHGLKFPYSNAIAWNGTSIGWAYQTTGVTLSERDIWFHLIGADGSMASAPVYVSPSSATTQPCCPNLAWAEGEFLVGYISDMSTTYGRALALRRIAANGSLASPEIPVITVTTDALSDIEVARVGSQLFAEWIRWNTTTGYLEGSWFDLQGSPLGSTTVYEQWQHSDSTSISNYGALSLPDRAVVFTLERDDQTSIPVRALEQRHVSPAGSVIFGPQEIAEYTLPIGGYVPRVAADGYGIGWTHQEPADQAAQVYLRRTSTDGVVASTSFRVSDVPPSRSLLAVDLAYNPRAYGVAWMDNREVTQEWDIFFDTAAAYEILPVGQGPSPTASPLVKLCQPETGGAPITVVPYAAAGYGANVGAGQTDGDEPDELLTGPGPGPSYGPQVRAFQWRGTPVAKVNFYAYGTLRFGAKVASGRLDGDAFDEILTAPGPGAVFGPHVRGFDVDAGTAAAMPKVSFFAYGTLRYGANVAAGDIEKDGFAEILTGPGPSGTFGTQLRGFDYDGAAVQAISRINTFAFPGATHGLHVAAGDTDWDDMAEIACTKGPGAANDTQVAVYDDDGTGLVEKPGSRFEAFAGSLGGAQVAFCQWWGRDFHRELLLSRGGLPSSSTEVSARDDSAAGFAPQASFVPFPGGTHGATMGSLFPGF